MILWGVGQGPEVPALPHQPTAYEDLIAYLLWAVCRISSGGLGSGGSPGGGVFRQPQYPPVPGVSPAGEGPGGFCGYGRFAGDLEQGLRYGGILPAGGFPGGGALPLLLPAPPGPGGPGGSGPGFRSRHQRHDLVREVAQQAAAEAGTEFSYEDFRQGWAKGVAESKAMRLYRQNYCGCLFSERERHTQTSKRARQK